MKLHLDALEDRLALSTVDLTTAGSSGLINEALFQQCDAQPTGTGYIRSFVRVQGANANAWIEHGYNTDARPLGYEDGIDTIGTQGGSSANDRFFDIFLAAGVDGEENNFAEFLLAGS